MSAEAAAFAPGHITSFFEIHDAHPDPMRKGSRGAGFSVALGVLSHVAAQPGPEQRVEVLWEGSPVEAPVTAQAVRNLLGASRTHVRVQAQLHLPVSQGFGMSAAGALSAAMALAKALRLPRSDALVAAHKAEVQQRTGLGDVVGAMQGGIEVRREPGLPPWGSVQRVLGEAELVLCVLEGPLETRKVLQDPQARERIKKAGRAAMAGFLEAPNLPNLFRLGKAFSVESGLATEKVLRAIRAAELAGGMAGQSMLGNSIYAYAGDVGPLEEALRTHGQVFRTRIEPTGARVVEVTRAGGPAKP